MVTPHQGHEHTARLSGRGKSPLKAQTLKSPVGLPSLKAGTKMPKVNTKERLFALNPFDLSPPCQSRCSHKYLI